MFRYNADLMTDRRGLTDTGRQLNTVPAVEWRRAGRPNNTELIYKTKFLSV